MWYSFELDGQLEIINPITKNVLKYGLEGAVLLICPEAKNIRKATDEEIKSVFDRLRSQQVG
jgi:hypothetical protein